MQRLSTCAIEVRYVVFGARSARATVRLRRIPIAVVRNSSAMFFGVRTTPKLAHSCSLAVYSFESQFHHSLTHNTREFLPLVSLAHGISLKILALKRTLEYQH